MQNVSINKMQTMPKDALQNTFQTLATEIITLVFTSPYTKTSVFLSS